jgi:acetoacetyl-CoA synthetase
MSTPLWQPTADFINNSNLKSYENWLLRKRGLQFEDADSLWQWSVEHIEDFWESIWNYFEVIAHTPYQQVLKDRQMPEAVWFEGASLNYAEHIFRHKHPQRSAIIFQNEQKRLHISWSDLEHRVLSMQQYLKRVGIKKGDRVAAYLPNIPEAIVCFLAVNSVGAIWSCCSPDFGVETVLERFEQIEPKLLVACDGYWYNQKMFPRLEEVESIRSHIQSIEQTLFIPYLDADATLTNATYWRTIRETQVDGTIEFTPVPFDHPIWVLYSSGTTGKPKAITHSHGGVLLEHLKYMTFHNDVKAGENFFWFTTTGWMMWNFLQASLLVGATAVLYDGSPARPNLKVLWQLAAELPIHHFGTSAPYLVACMNADLNLKDDDLSALRSIGSTGAPLPPEAFRWVYEAISEDIWLCSMSGGTDVCTAFVGGHPYRPVVAGRIQSRALGCALYAYAEDGERLHNELGEMVIEQPMPSMPIYFWNDEGNDRYRNSYFDTFDSKWRHGDWIQIFKDGSLIIQGRSDATLNRKGIRIGTAEIYRIVEQIEGIKDALIVNIEKSDGSDFMPLFVVLHEGSALDDELKQQLFRALREQASPRHVPDALYVVPDIPYTLSGKKMEVPVKKLLMGRTLSTKDTMRNPRAMEWFEAFEC